MLSYLQQGGPVMYVLLAFSITALAICLLKVYNFWQVGIWSSDIVEDALEHLKAGRVKQALSLLQGSKKPTAIITFLAINCCLDKNLKKADRSAEIRRHGSKILIQLESYLKGLSTIANMSPLLGLLGTVTGMIAAFASLEKAGGQANPGLLAGGIWEALLTTAFGLTVAIPTLVAFYFFENEIDKIKAKMKDAITQVLVVFNQSTCDHQEDLSDTHISEETYGF